MSFNYKSLLPTPAQIKAEFPLTPEFVELKAARDKEVADVITGKSEKFLVIIGPCSADREDAVCEYMSRLAKVNEQVKDKLVIVPRVYTNKPRTTGGGYKGMLHQPDPEKKPNMYEGLVAIRKLHMRVIKDYGFTTADEMLYRKITAIFPMYFPTLRSARVLLRTSSTALYPAVWTFRSE